MAGLIRKCSKRKEDRNMNSCVPNTNHCMIYDNNRTTYSRKKRIKLDTDASEQDQSLISNSVFVLSTDLAEMAQEWNGTITIKQEINDDVFSNGFDPKSVTNDPGINSFINQGVDLCNDLQFQLKEEHIDMKDEIVLRSSESHEDRNVVRRNVNEFILGVDKRGSSQYSSEVVQLEPGYKKVDVYTLPVVTVDMIHDFYIHIYLSFQSKLGGSFLKRKLNENYGDEAIQHVQFLRERGKVSLKCRVIPNEETKQKVYRAEIIINERVNEIESCECVECSAVQERCKHAIAFLYWLHRRTEDPSPNLQDCFWMDQPHNKVNKKCVTCYNFGEGPSSIDVDTASFLKSFIRNTTKDYHASILKFVWCEPSPDLHKLIIRFTNGGCQHDVDHFLNFCRAAVTNEMCGNILRRTAHRGDLRQEVQYGRIMSSTLYAASRQNRSGSLKNLILRTAVPDTRTVKRERKLKKFVLGEVAHARNFQIVYPAGIQLRPDCPVFGAALDGITEEYCVLVKCPSKGTKMSKYIVGNKIKEKFYCQLMMQLHLCKKRKGLFCVAAPNFAKTHRVYIIEVLYDCEYLLEKMETALQYWRENIFPILLQSYRIN